MKKAELRKLATSYLLPFFPGASIEQRTESSNSTQRVAWKDPQRLAFKVEAGDPYRLIIYRSQGFARINSRLVTESDVTEAFVSVLRDMKRGLSQKYRDDLLNSFSRRVVARAIGGASRENAVLSIIDLLNRWSLTLYEGAPVSASIGLEPTPRNAPGLQAEEVWQLDRARVLSNGFDTIHRTDFSGHYLGHQTLSTPHDNLEYAPLRYAALAGWAQGERIALALNRQGEILIFKNSRLIFARRSGHWFFLGYEPIRALMSPPQSAALRAALLETVIDASFARTGACFGVAVQSTGDEWESRVEQGDRQGRSQEAKALMIERIVGDVPFQDLDRRLRQELAAVDGATVLDYRGKVLAVGAIIRIDPGSDGGGRLAAAKALGELGLGVKVSQDGGVEAYRAGARQYSE